MTTPTRYRRKPKVINVIVWTGDNLDDVAEFLDGYVSEFSVFTRKGPGFHMSLDGSYGARLWVTKSQWCDVNLGDGIAQETDRFYPIAADRLGEDFDPVDEQPTTDQPVTAEMVYEAIEAAEIRGGLNPGYGPMYVRPCDWTKAEAATVADALNRLLAERLPAAAPQDDRPAEMLFTGGVRRVIAPGNSGRSPLRVVVPASAEEALKPGDLVDVYPHAQRPTDTPTTNQPVTAESLLAAFKQAGFLRADNEDMASLADALNRLLAEQAGEG